MNVEAFYPFISHEVLGCPEPMVGQALISAANEFCVESSVWHESLSENLIPGVVDYELDNPSQSYIVSFREVRVGETKLTPVNQIFGEEVGKPAVYASPEFGAIRLYPIPSEVATLTADCIYGPIPSATSLPDFMLRHTSTLAAGAKGILLAMTGVAWSNPQLAAYYSQRFSSGVIAARIAEEHGRNPSSLSIKPRTFGYQ